jgi:hypothetical protein
MQSEDVRQRAPADDGLPVSAVQPWYEPESEILEQPWLTSSTDLLIAWHPEPVVPGAPQMVDWEKYFHPAAAAIEAAKTQPSPQTGVAEPWDPAGAGACVDCLFRFVRSLEAVDVDAAMACVSADYHAMMNDKDLDRDALRLRLDGMVDAWRGPELRVSLTEIPDPIFHDAGVLIRVTFQADYRDKQTGEMVTALLPYVIWFTEDRRGHWFIRALAGCVR